MQKQMQCLKTLLLLGLATASSAVQLRGQALVAADPHTPQTCHALFAYEESVKMCLGLQKLICGKDCDFVMKDDKSCPEMQKLVCTAPAVPDAEKPVKVEPKLKPVPPDDKTARVTVCNAYPSDVSVDIHHNKYYILEDPIVIEDLEYTQCVQFVAQGEEELIFKVGDHSSGLHIMGDDVNHLVLFGQFELGKKEPGFRHFGWKDEGYERPIVCSTYPDAKPGRFYQDGVSLYPFSNPHNTKGLLGYMECEVMALDKQELVQGPKKMGAEFANGKSVSFDVSVVDSLYLIGDDTAKHEPRMKAYHFDHLKNKLSEDENGRRFYVPHYPEQLGKPPMQL